MIITTQPHRAAAQGFINQCGIVATDQRKNIRDFVEGCFDLGIWSSMVCWPLRSTQNAGTGTTVHSLGGLGSFPGTMVNGPTWGVNGVTFASASTHRIALPISIATAQLHSLALGVCSFSSTVSFNRIFDIQDVGSNTRRNPILMYEAFGSMSGFNLPNSGVTSNEVTVNLTDSLNQFLSVCGSKEGGTMRVSVNGVSQNTLSGITFSIGTGYNTALIGEGVNGTLAFAMLAGSDFSSGQVSALHTLYRNTLGQGLGLP